MKRRFNYRQAFWIVIFLAAIEAFFLFLSLKPRARPAAKRVLPKKTVVSSFKGNIAIVIDDFGYNTNNLALLSTIKQPLTVSILPNLDYSSFLSDKLHAFGFEVILHLPLEPQEKYRLEKDTILTNMSEASIRPIIASALESIRFTKGVSNHMGSKATEKERTMAIIFNELKKRRLYFLDSFVSVNSICEKLSGRLGVAFAKRDIFLDNEKDPDYIKQQLYKLRARAAKIGHAVGIGHDRKTTIEVLKETMPQLEKEGFKFVFVSDLVR